MGRKTTGILILLALPFLLKGQYKLEQPVLVGKEHGLPSHDVRSIRKGTDGFIWLASSEGLCRFDGQQVKVYKPSAYAPGLKFDNMVTAVLPLDKEIWMGTSQGLAVLDPETEAIRYYQLAESGKADTILRSFDQSVTLLYQDRQGDIWLGTRDRGAWMYEKGKDNFRKFLYPHSAYNPIKPVLGANHTILSIEASRYNDSIIYVGTVAGLQEINKVSGEVRWYTYPKDNKEQQVALNAFRRMYHHDNGLLYVGSWNAGVNVFDPETKTFTPLQVKKGDPHGIIRSTITSIKRKSNQELWITTGRGLVVYDTQLETVTWYKLNRPDKNEYYGVDYIDDANRIWHTNINGIQYYDPVVQQFTHYSFEELFSGDWAFVFYMIPEKDRNSLIVCPRVGEALYRFDKYRKSWTAFPFRGLKGLGFSNIIVRGFVELEPGHYMISADEGLFLYDLYSQQLRVMPKQPPVRYKRWGDLEKDAQGNVWITADADGLIRWDRKKDQFRVFKAELSYGSDSGGVGRQSQLYHDSRGNIWLARMGGYSVYLQNEDRFVHQIFYKDTAHSFPFIFDFAEDRNGRIWMSTGDGWYGYADMAAPEKGIIRKFDLKERNISGHFTYLARDLDGNVWGFTPHELIRINTSDLSISQFSFSYGVKSGDFFHFNFLPSGEMVFGGRNEITIANPSELQRNRELPVPYIMQLKVLNRPVASTPLLNLTLNHRENFLSLFFSAKAYTMPQGVVFRYRLKGFDDWVETSTGRLANYTNIPPGDYTFQLQAANNERIWNEHMLEIPIHIATPWWLTWWFRIATVFLFFGGIYWLYRFRIKQVKKKEKLKTQYEKKLANVEMTALLAQMNPHFLFNSLNSIDSYIIRNESGKASEYLNNFARLMRLILQNSRSNYISLKDELESLELYLQMESLRFRDKFQYKICVSESLDAASVVIPPMLIQPYVENAIWHGLMHKKDGGCGVVEIHISQDRENNLVCVVRDNGIGRVKAEALKAQNPGNRKKSMGMQITRDRIDMINKLYNTSTEVKITDLVDGEGQPAGTEVRLVIPI